MVDGLVVKFKFGLGAYVRLVGTDIGKWRVVERRASQLLDDYVVGVCPSLVYCCRDVEFSTMAAAGTVLFHQAELELWKDKSNA